MIDRANRLSSSPALFSQESKKTENFTFARFQATLGKNQETIAPADNPVRIVLPFEYQKSADFVCQELRSPIRKIGHVLQPVFTSRKISD